MISRETRWFLLLLCTFLPTDTVSWMGDRGAAETSTVTVDPYDWELPPSVFGSNGRLFAVDLAMRAVEYESSTVAIALCCSEGVVVVSTLPESPYLQMRETGAKDSDRTAKEEATESQDDDSTDANSRPSVEASSFRTLLLNYQDVGVSPILMPPFARIRDDVLSITAGNPIHSQLLQQHLSRFNSRQSYHTAPSSALARQLADRMQQATQQSDRMMQHATVLVWDTHQQLWRIDPTGQFWLCKAVVAGRCARATEQILLRELRQRLPQEQQQRQPSSSQQLHTALESLSATEAIVLARDCIRTSFQSASPSQRKDDAKLPRMVAIVSHKDNAEASSSSQRHDAYTHQEVVDL